MNQRMNALHKHICIVITYTGTSISMVPHTNNHAMKSPATLILEVCIGGTVYCFRTAKRILMPRTVILVVDLILHYKEICVLKHTVCFNESALHRQIEMTNWKMDTQKYDSFSKQEPVYLQQWHTACSQTQLVRALHTRKWCTSGYKTGPCIIIIIIIFIKSTCNVSVWIPPYPIDTQCMKVKGPWCHCIELVVWYRWLRWLIHVTLDEWTSHPFLFRKRKVSTFFCNMDQFQHCARVWVHRPGLDGQCRQFHQKRGSRWI